MLLCGKPVILYSIEAFFDFDPEIQIILVLHPEYQEYWKQLCKDFKISIPTKIATGGETRFESVKNGLELVDDNGFVAVHDAARPVINKVFIRSLFDQAEKYGSAIPGVPLNDTIRLLEGDTSHQLDRTFLRAMQTPQVYKAEELKRAYTQAFRPIFTDEASVMQSAGFPLHLTEGRSENIKITHANDIAIAEILIKF
jgi:2-C-methyl-D-erythritol 4-phosphate cytidylyltransferase